MGLLKAMFGSYSKKEMKRIQPLCDKTLALESKYEKMTDSELKAQTTLLKERLEAGETTDDILPDAFAVCREILACTGYEALPRTDSGRYHSPSGQNCRNEDR